MDNAADAQRETDISDNQIYQIPNYKFTKTLGSGTFGKVKAAIHIPTGQSVAIKIIDKRTLKDSDDRQRVQREVQIMKSIRHPNIIQLYEKIQTDHTIFLVVEYAENGELFKLMSDQVRLNERASGRIFIQLMNAVQYLHRLGIAHRDLKPENILLDVDYNIKLIDFGLSNFSQKGQFLHTACGSPCYAPPQMVSGNSYEGQIGDVWSMGIIFYGMICGSLPFEENTTRELYKKVIEGFYVIPSDISLQATQVIRKMLVTTPKQRITIPELRKLKFFTNLRQIQPKIIGIIVGFHPMPIDNQILQKMRKITTFDRNKIEDQIKQNQHTNYTTLYYLLQKQSLRSGNKTVVDLQYYLQSNQRYKNQYGTLPEQFRSEQQDEQKYMNSSKTIKTIKNTKNKKKYTINGTKGLSKQRRRPIKIKQKSLTEATQKTERQEIAERLFTTVKKYRLQTEKNQKNSESKNQSLFTQRKDRLKVNQSYEKSRQKGNRSKSSHNYSPSQSNKKSAKKSKQQQNTKLALNLWNAYFEKPLQSTAKKQIQPNTARGIKLKAKQKQADRVFNQNLQKLKQGFLKLPMMNKAKKKQYQAPTQRQQQSKTKKVQTQIKP